MRTLLLCLLLCRVVVNAELIDEIAIVVDKSIIKDSDLNRNIRLTEFLNNEPLHVDPAERKKSARRLIDQALLRQEIRTSGYPNASNEEANTELKAIEESRFHSRASFHTALAKFGLDEPILREQLRWNLTVLHFIDARFSPAAAGVSDSQIDAYYREHESGLRKKKPQASKEQLRSEVQEILTADEVNRSLFSFLDQRRKEAKIRFLVDGLV